MSKKFKRILIVVFFFYFLLQIFSIGIAKKETPALHERVIVSMTSPVQWVAKSAFSGIKNAISGYVFLVNVKKENSVLKEAISELKQKTIDYREMQLENMRLKSFFNLNVDDKFVRVVAKRIAYGSSRFEQTIRIQKGRRQGIYEGAAVLNTDGIIGQVVEVYRSYSDVLLITDSASSIDVIIQRSRANGMLKGGARDNLLFEFLSKESDVFEGDVVISSGLDGIYPKGFPVGKVSAVGQRSKGLFLEASVKPFVEFHNIEEVIVLLKQDGVK